MIAAEPVGGGLHRRDIVHGEKGVVVLAEADLLSVQFLLHKRVPVQPIGGVERKETRHANDNWSQDFVPDVEVVMRKAARLMRQNAVIRILRGVFRYADPECPALLHALEDEVDAEGLPLLHAAQRGQDVFFFANAFACPFDRDPVVAGEGLHPLPVIVGPAAEDFLAHHRNAEDFPNKVNHLLRSGKPVQVSVNDNAVEAVIYKNQQAAKQLCESLHRSSPLFSSDNKIIGQTTGGFKISNMFG